MHSIKTIGDQAAYVEAMIGGSKSEYIWLEDSSAVICILTLDNGYQFTGRATYTSYIADDEPTDEEIANNNAIKKAATRLWRIVGYMAHLGYENI